MDYHRSLGPILEDSLEGLLHVDGKFFRTVRWLFTRPGFLTAEFNAGRRVAYTQPLRLYIFASFLYFALGLFVGHSPVKVDVTPDKPGAATVSSHAAEGTGKAAKVDLSAAAPSALGRLLEGLKAEDQQEVSRELAHLLPTMAFFCIPLLGSALLLAYRGGGRVYVEHLIFALHIQALYFLTAFVAELVEALLHPLSAAAAGISGTLFFLGGAWLVYRAFRVVYGQSPGMTILKMALVGIGYSIVLILGMTLTAIAAALIVLGNHAGAR